MKTVFVFGTFDGLHPGHDAFLAQAKACGDELVVSVAQDEIVEKLKHRAPDKTLTERLTALEEHPLVARAVPGDSKIGTYQCFQAVKPDIVAFGYDQDELAKDFHRFQQTTGDETPTVVLKPYQAEIYKTSLLRTKKYDRP